MTAGFDTLAAAKDLQGAGMDQRQAEAIAQAIRSGQDNLATKADLADVKIEIYKVALGIVVANAAIVFGLLKLLLPS